MSRTHKYETFVSELHPVSLLFPICYCRLVTSVEKGQQLSSLVAWLHVLVGQVVLKAT